MSGLKEAFYGDNFCPPFQSHSSTSRVAARSIAKHTKSAEQRVLEFLQSRPYGATDEQIDDALRFPGCSTLRPRRVRLEQIGKVRDSGRTSLTKSNRSAVIWEAT